MFDDNPPLLGSGIFDRLVVYLTPFQSPVGQNSLPRSRRNAEDTQTFLVDLGKYE